jgi:hypothetical protein
MNAIFSGSGKSSATACRVATVILLVVIFGVIPSVGRLHAQTGSDPAAEFKNIAAELSAARLGGADESEARMQKALEYLDTLAVSALNVSASPDLEGANRRLAGLAAHTPPVGENYRLVKIGGTPAAYAMEINFGLGGPAAVRIYAGGAGHYALAARIDHIVQKDFLDSDVELVPVSGSEPVFVTVSGRTDDLSTGAFTAWQFSGHGVAALWNSDLLQQSSYQAEDGGFRIAYCSQVNEDRPSECLKMSRDLYRFQGGEWKRTETVDLPMPKPAAK